MQFTIYLSLRASKDIIDAVEYYNSKSTGLGKRLAFEVDTLLSKIANLPETYSLRYRNVRAAKVSTFPYLIFYKIEEAKSVIQVLRIFNTHQQPFWKH
jgi:plasmid stabilization system protein ParE